MIFRRPEHASALANRFHFAAGAALLALNKIRHGARGYRSPRPFSSADVERTIAHDLHAVERYAAALDEYAGGPAGFEGKTLLEIGPGPDLGAGILLLARGAARYIGFDVNELVAGGAAPVHERLIERIEREAGASPAEAIRNEVAKWESGRPGRLRYVRAERLRPEDLRGERVDLVLSQATMEHLPDVEESLARLRRVVHEGALFLAEIDLRTHTRWIRDVDPLNIYRYADRFYDRFRFAGSPNRLRPVEYERLLARTGWGQIRTWAVEALPGPYLRSVLPHVAPRFRAPEASIGVLGVTIGATAL